MAKVKNTLGIEYHNLSDIEKYRFKQFIATTKKLNFRVFLDRVQYQELPEETAEIGYWNALKTAKGETPKSDNEVVTKVLYSGNFFQEIETNKGRIMESFYSRNPRYAVGDIIVGEILKN